jgi:hypothetical protein
MYATNLSRRGWNVQATSRNARGIDLTAYDQSGKHHITVQVKALSKQVNVPVGNDDNLIADYVVVCVDALDRHPKCYVVKAQQITDGLIGFKGKKDGKYWLPTKAYMDAKFLDDLPIPDMRNNI